MKEIKSEKYLDNNLERIYMAGLLNKRNTVYYRFKILIQKLKFKMKKGGILEVREDDKNHMNPIDRLFEELEKRNPTHFAVKQYRKYKLAAGKTAKSILISCGVRLAPFDIEKYINQRGKSKLS